ncbi:cytidylate kinase, putative [Methanomethylovorans hollandica DSM 15978]|uniref:Cytidylate kinase n=1 Tax=Methanomethylovorans hollandica (strain DSM 15978 / NBRC 107637 / DMS1) TaxID=867904 RepID=L0L190_METHD|nr:AAA family ATPase [Methanomethylovorans hollandica]AGB50168.1 cytidylate kinase, putative [Methanomethylovorans hollandica DSM 15978]
MLITISGLPGSGTTTVSSLLAKSYGMELISAGEVFRTLAKERGLTLAEFGELAEKDDSIDVQIDKRQQEIAATRNNIILEGRLAGHMAPHALKVWIKAHIEVRVQRIVGRENTSFQQAFEETLEREASEASRYREIHGIDINDLSVYDIVIDSHRWDQFQIAHILSACIDTLINKGGERTVESS